MLIAVPGSSDLGGVLGVGPADPDALLRAIRDRFGPFRHRHVLVLSPEHLAVAAREQAHVVIAADPAARICVLPLRHHALTLSLIGRAVLAAELRPGGWSDPGESVHLVRSIAAHSRSLVWHPRLGSLAEPSPTVGERAIGLLPSRSYFYELGSSGLVPVGAGPVPSDPSGWHVAGPPPSPLQSALPGVVLEPVDYSPAGYRPYAGRRSVEVTHLASPYFRPWSGPKCPNCSASLVGALCAFCGCGPATEERLDEVSPARQEGIRI
ncbi:hypothetical protein [Microlunatus sp. GCM10028923]|uniref:hypothetical protein n=1 Tax=Microlunatus sp. GCM10028923 TaxID=3273400 RepID=UPI003612A4E6